MFVANLNYFSLYVCMCVYNFLITLHTHTHTNINHIKMPFDPLAKTFPTFNSGIPN